MKRTIKFRGKSLETGEWLYGDLYHTDELACICDWGIRPHTVENFAVNSNTVGQFTGLYDKNGKEVYEGDMLHIRAYNNEAMCDMSFDDRELFSVDELKGKLKYQNISSVKYEEGVFYCGDYYLCSFFGDMRHSQPIFDYEVIGNIHDELELLTQQ